MTRRLVRLAVVAIVMVTVLAVAAPPAQARDLWELLFGCEGLFPISCPGPVIW